jgi:FkbM family methyltransferase
MLNDTDGQDTNAVFHLHGVEISLPQSILSAKMREVFANEKYEGLEARYIERVVRDGDRLLELGGGVGFISTLASKKKALEACLIIEANPDLRDIILDTHQRNGSTATVITGVACPPDSTIDAPISFYLRENFWGSSLNSQSKYVRKVDVPRIDLQNLLREYRPTVVICDIEGGEVDLFPNIDMTGVDRIYFELHKTMTGLSKISRLFTALMSQGLFYDPDASVGAVVLFSRQVEETGSAQF